MLCTSHPALLLTIIVPGCIRSTLQHEKTPMDLAKMHENHECIALFQKVRLWVSISTRERQHTADSHTRPSIHATCAPTTSWLHSPLNRDMEPHIHAVRCIYDLDQTHLVGHTSICVYSAQTHSLTHWVTHSLIHSLTDWLTDSITHALDERIVSVSGDLCEW